MNGLDLFSGIGGIGLALAPWVRTVAYCERDRYAQAVILSRIASGELDNAPIWDDVTTLGGDMLPEIDIIFGGFPCQDISTAGRGAGLAGERSGLFFEIMRLVDELRPRFIFLENVAAITVRGLGTVTAEIARRGYDCRWTTLSAAEVGANHKRNRWWLLAYAKGERILRESGDVCGQDGGSGRALSGKSDFSGALPDPLRQRIRQQQERELGVTGKAGIESDRENVADADGLQCKRIRESERLQKKHGAARGAGKIIPDPMSERLKESRRYEYAWDPETCRHRQTDYASNANWWKSEPDVGRVVNGLPNRMDRIKCLGNSVVPLCAREAFKELMGIR